MLLELYLGMSRVDLAEKQLKLMKAVDEDAVLTMLASAQLMMAPVTAPNSSALFVQVLIFLCNDIAGIFKVSGCCIHLRRVDRQVWRITSLAQWPCCGQDAPWTFRRSRDFLTRFFS